MIILEAGQDLPMGFQLTPKGATAAQLRLAYRSGYPNWEYLTAVRGQFFGLSTSGDPKNTWLIVEGEYGNAECEPYVRIDGTDWRIGIAVGQSMKDEVVIEPAAYSYLIEIPEPGMLHYLVTNLTGAVVLDWTGPHGGGHDYFSEYSTSLECYFRNGCSSHHMANHLVYFVFDSKARIWIDATIAYTLKDEPRKEAICTGIIPKATAVVENYTSSTYYSDFCEVVYG